MASFHFIQEIKIFLKNKHGTEKWGTSGICFPSALPEPSCLWTPGCEATTQTGRAVSPNDDVPKLVASLITPAGPYWQAGAGDHREPSPTPSRLPCLPRRVLRASFRPPRGTLVTLSSGLHLDQNTEGALAALCPQPSPRHSGVLACRRRGTNQ